ncbi:FRIGIDA-like protein 4a [Ziziphus jujuba]|uniref:FRIGIDA-like protein n=2 Tax=Ziziphus jujuba TaxID=326968 RepID=A0A6P3ZAL0_ZIZJJ|nr:FRIGIDA-like protein 4a [Ziziphus jujuba]KAH7543178.1 hypothetical protein FEM48_Zijuj02G0155700 [Ziziphus jujuba var. spinosa]
MSTTTAERISSGPQLSDTNKQQIRKAFNLIKTHASAVANFTLQWQELEDHFIFINNSIQSKLQEFRRKNQSLDTQFTSAQQSQLSTLEEDVFSPTLQGHSNSKETHSATSPSVPSQCNPVDTQIKNEESFRADSNFNDIPRKNGKVLLVYLNGHLKEHESMRDGVHNALKASEDSAKLVLEAIEEGFCPTELKTGGGDLEVSATRRSCVLLLEEFMKVAPLVKPRAIEQAAKLASLWKANIKAEVWNSIEVWGFLLLLGAYALVDRFDSDEILELFKSVVQRKQAPELFRSLGLADKASDFIQHLISEKKQLAAVRFIFAFEMIDKFSPVPLLKAHLNHVKKVARVPLKKGKNSLKAQNDATNKEIASLKSVIKCIEDYELESEYSPENLRARIDRLRKMIKERKGMQTASGSQAQVQQLSGNKRTAPKAQMNKQKGKNKQPRMAPAAAVQHVSARAAATIHSLQQHQGAQYLSAAGVAASAAAPSTSFVAASNFYSVDASHNQQDSPFTIYQKKDSPFTGHGAQYSAGRYSFSRSIPDTHMSVAAGSYGFVGSPPVVQRPGLTAGGYGLHRETVTGHYTLGGSGSVTSRMDSSNEQYGTSIAASGRSGQFGSAGTLTATGISSNVSPRSSLSYFHGDPLRVPSYNNRAAFSSSGYEMPSKRPPAIYRL